MDTGHTHPVCAVVFIPHLQQLVRQLSIIPIQQKQFAYSINTNSIEVLSQLSLRGVKV